MDNFSFPKRKETKELRKQLTDPDFVEPNEGELKKYHGVAVKETTLEKLVAYLGNRKLSTSRMLEPKKFDGILDQA